MTANTSVQSSPLVSDERLRETLRRELDRAINVERTFTRQQLALESGVNIHTLDAIMSRDPSKHRRICADVALSLVSVLGGRAVNSLMAVIGYAARPLDEADALDPMRIAATSMGHLATIAAAAADGRIDHTEEPATRQAADLLIATVLPLSTASKRN